MKFFLVTILDQINDDKLMDSLKREKFDLGIGESFDACYYGVLKRLCINNYITVSSTILFDNDAMALGIPTMPSFVPSRFLYKNIIERSFYFFKVYRLRQKFL